MVQPGFLSTSAGNVFTVRHYDQAPSRGAVVVVPPFAEEMNCCRRIVTKLATQLTPAGYQLFLFDFFGTGDSSGQIEDATADIWLQNLGEVLAHVRAEHDLAAVLSIRLGSHIALQVQDLFADVQHICWQPLLSTRMQFTELCRHAAISQRLRKERSILSVDSLFAELEAGNTVDLAGYSVTSKLGQSLLDLDNNVPEQNSSECLVARPCKSIPPDWHCQSVKTSKYWQLIDAPFPRQLINETICKFH